MATLSLALARGGLLHCPGLGLGRPTARNPRRTPLLRCRASTTTKIHVDRPGGSKLTVNKYSLDDPHVVAAVLFLPGTAMAPSSYVTRLEALADKGIAVYTPDIPGPNSFKFELYQTAYFEDSKRCIAVMKNDLDADVFSAGRVGLSGDSLGGSTAFRLVKENPDLFSSVLAVSPETVAVTFDLGQDVRDTHSTHSIRVKVLSGLLDFIAPTVAVRKDLVRPLQDNPSFDVAFVELPTGIHTSLLTPGAIITDVMAWKLLQAGSFAANFGLIYWNLGGLSFDASTMVVSLSSPLWPQAVATATGGFFATCLLILSSLCAFAAPAVSDSISLTMEEFFSAKESPGDLL